MMKKVIISVYCLLVVLVSLLVMSCGGNSSAPTQVAAPPTSAAAKTTPPATSAAPITTTPPQTTTAKPSPPPTTASKYSAADCKVLTAADIASVLGVSAADVTELPVQKSEGACIESFTVKIGGMPIPVGVTLTDTKKAPLYGAEPKVCLANAKKMLAADKPSLGIGDYDSYEMVGGTVMFGKGIYMVQVTCPMNVTIDKTIALAKLVAQHI